MLNPFYKTPTLIRQEMSVVILQTALCSICLNCQIAEEDQRASSLIMTRLLLLVFLPLTSCSKVDLDCIHENEECQIVSEKRKDNLLRTVMGVSTLESCLALCKSDQGNLNGQKCQAVTHFGAESYPFRDACMLFSHCKKRRC